MIDVRWRKIEKLFHDAVELEPYARAAVLREACSNEQLRKEVESLLDIQSEAKGFLELPALEEAARNPAHSKQTRLP